jgi:hypothetical protein
MTDIVERLRQHQDAWKISGDLPVPQSFHSLPDALGEAADEIALMRTILTNAVVLNKTQADVIERLRKTLREIEDSSNDPRAVREARAALGGKP